MFLEINWIELISKKIYISILLLKSFLIYSIQEAVSLTNSHTFYKTKIYFNEAKCLNA